MEQTPVTVMMQLQDMPETAASNTGSGTGKTILAANNLEPYFITYNDASDIQSAYIHKAVTVEPVMTVVVNNDHDEDEDDESSYPTVSIPLRYADSLERYSQFLMSAEAKVDPSYTADDLALAYFLQDDEYSEAVIEKVIDEFASFQQMIFEVLDSQLLDEVMLYLPYDFLTLSHRNNRDFMLEWISNNIHKRRVIGDCTYYSNYQFDFVTAAAAADNSGSGSGSGQSNSNNDSGQLDNNSNGNNDEIKDNTIYVLGNWHTCKGKEVGVSVFLRNDNDPTIVKLEYYDDGVLKARMSDFESTGISPDSISDFLKAATANLSEGQESPENTYGGSC